MEQASPIFYLAIVTLLAGVVFGVWQYRRTRKAQGKANKFGKQ